MIFYNPVEARPPRVAGPERSEGFRIARAKGEGRRSRRAAFTADELVAVAKSAGLSPGFISVESYDRGNGVRFYPHPYLSKVGRERSRPIFFIVDL